MVKSNPDRSRSASSEKLGAVAKKDGKRTGSGSSGKPTPLLGDSSERPSGR